MKRTLAVAIVAALCLSALMGPTAAQDEIVPVNGTAYWATEPTAPDFGGVSLIPFPAHNPTRAAWEATQIQNQSYLSPDSLPVNIQVSHSGWFTYASHYLNDFSEVMVYLDPTDPDHLLGASKFFYEPANYDFYTGVFESYDGGYTWSQFQPDGVENYSLTSDPVTTFDDQGNGYFTLLTRGPTGLDMLKKPVGGGWELPVVVDRTTSTDKQWIMGDQDPQGISPYAGYLYMSWTSFGGPVTGIVFSRSTDGNQTWSTPIQLSGGDVQGSIPGVAPDGTVYVVFGRGIFYGGAGTLEFVESADGGASFGSAAVAANITAIPYLLPDPFGNPQNFRSPASLPAFAVSPTNGNLYISWADYRNGDADIYFTRSTDGGTTWDPQIRLNDDPLGNGIDQFQPQVSVAPNGRVAVMWFDRRLPCPDLPWIPPAHVGVLNGCIDTFMTRSFDDGQTWVPNIRASAQTWDWTLNLPWTGQAGFIGDYQGIASNDEVDFPFWNATANLGENTENYQEVFVALVPVTAANLAPSWKAVEPEVVLPGDVLTYTLLLDNAGPEDAPAVRLTDTVPISTTYVPGSLAYPPGVGTGGYDPATDAITWTGAVSVGLPVTLTFQVTVNLDLGAGATVTNTAFFTNGLGAGYERTATATVGEPPVPPVIESTYPADGEIGVPVTASLVITFSEAMDTSTLLYSVAPDPGGWTVTWSDGNRVVTLAPAGWATQQVYTVTVAAEDEAGEPLVPGPVPNPWSFATIGPPPQIVHTEPADGQTGVPVTMPLVITFSEPMITATLHYTVTPDPGGWVEGWNGDATAVTLSHGVLAYSQTYTVTVAARDPDGLALVPGPVPNPWSFTTEARPLLRIYLPVVLKVD
jgi:uncharacterized repeat protein (TIGR01451 family)